MIEINLKNNKGFNWYSNNNIYVKGYAFDENNNLLEKENFTSLFKNTKDLNSFKKIIEKLNGVFAVIAKIEDQVFLATDITRTFPLFYTKIKERIFISDESSFLKEKLSLKLNQDSIDEFKCTGYVTKQYTLYQNLYQVQTAEIIKITETEIVNEEYWSYGSTLISNNTFKDLENKLEIIFENIIKRLIKSVGNKTIIVPLSGGFDSRIIVALLKKLNYENVICFTYGKKNNFEAKKSKEIATKLQYKWLFVEYTEELLEKSLQSEEWQNYCEYSSNGVSLPHIGDFTAIKYLKENKLIPIDSVVVPGHSGDIFAGTHIPKNILELTEIDEVKSEILKKHYSHCENNPNITNLNVYNTDFLYSISEAWSWKERQAKFIINSNKVYEYFGFEHRVPLWDLELSNFFKEIGLNHKNRNNLKTYISEENLYDSVCKTFFKSYNIDNDKSIFNSLLPKILCKFFKLCKYRDPLNFLFMKNLLEVEKNTKYVNINSTLIRYYLKKILK